MKPKNILIAIILILSITITHALSTSDLTSYFKLDETSGLTANDVLGINNGTITNAIVNQSGKINTSYYFDATSDYITLANESNFDFLTANAGTWSISMWVKPETINADRPLFSKSIYASDNGLTIIEQGSGAGTPNSIRLSLLTNGANYLTKTTPANSLTDGVWQLVTIRNNAGTITIDINGLTQSLTTGGAGAFTGNNNANQARIGAYDSTTSSWKGYIDEVGIWDVFLSGNDVNELYRSGSGLPYPFFVADNNSIKFKVIDENSGNEVLGAEITLDGNTITTDSVGVAKFDLTSFPTTNTNYTISLTKTGYSTRYYQVDLNKDSNVAVFFSIIPDSLDSDIPFKVYQTDETTIYADTFVEVKDIDNNYTIGRLKTNASGETTFNLRTNDTNYYMLVNNGEFTYTAVALTILYPKDEETGAVITNRWQIDLTGDLYGTYTDLNTTKIIYLLPNTANPFNVRISDVNGDYFPRTYSKQYPGNPLTDTLQPYLINVTTGLLTTVKTVSAYTNQPVPYINIKVYKLVPTLGETYVEEIVTDDKGEGIIYMIAGSEYVFKVYVNGVLVKSMSITGTSSTIYIQINDVDYENPILDDISFVTMFYPAYASLSLSDRKLIQTITVNDFNSSTVLQNIIITVINSGIDGNYADTNQVYSIVIPFTSATTYTNEIDINAIANTIEGQPYDENGTLIVNVILQTGDGNLYAQFIYKPYTTFSPFYSLGFGARTIFACDSYYNSYGNPNPLIPCPNMLLFALFVSFILTVGLAIAIQSTNAAGLGLIFVAVLGIFTYFTFVPIVLYGLITAITIVVILFARGRFN